MAKIIRHSHQVYFCIGMVRFAVSRDGGRIEIVNKWPDKMTAKTGPRASTEEKMRVGMIMMK